MQRAIARLGVYKEEDNTLWKRGDEARLKIEAETGSIVLREDSYLFNSRFNVIVTSCPTIRPPVSMVLFHLRL